MSDDREQSGVSLVELSIATVVLTIGLFAITSNSIKGVQRLTGMTKVVEGLARAGDVVHGLEKWLRGVLGHKPTGWVVEELLERDAARVAVDSLRGFPDTGMLELAPGTANAERIGYTRTVDSDGYRAFEQLTRGAEPKRHAVGTAVRWRAFGEVLPGTPAAGSFDGVSAAAGAPVHFRGDATGFCFQRWMLDGGERRLGAVIGAVPVADAWAALYFEPASELSEDERGVDLNRDGDRADTFDLGRLRLRSWAPPGANARFDDIVVSPSAIVQERGRWGRADLDGDRVADPLFLWHEDASKLQIQLVFWAGRDGGVRPFTKVETAIRLDRRR